MKALIARKVHFNAAHRLFNSGWSRQRNQEVFGKCSNENYHGHNYVLEARVRGEISIETGFVMDTKQLDEILQTEVIERFDHRNLNLDIEEFKKLNPTAENIAQIIYKLVKPKIGKNKELTIILHETERNYAEYNGE